MQRVDSLERVWCWEGLGAGGEGDDRGRNGWMASLTRWTWVWGNSGSWWWTGRPGMLRFMGSQRVGHDWATELNGKESACQCRRHKRCWFDPWVGKIPWRRKWQSILVFLPEKFHRQRRLESMGLQRVGHDWIHTHKLAKKVYVALGKLLNSSESHL